MDSKASGLHSLLKQKVARLPRYMHATCLPMAWPREKMGTEWLAMFAISIPEEREDVTLPPVPIQGIHGNELQLAQSRFALVDPSGALSPPEPATGLFLLRSRVGPRSFQPSVQNCKGRVYQLASAHCSFSCASTEDADSM